MEKDYVLDHDWGYYNSDDTINKLMLRNVDDFIKYFDKEIMEKYIAEKRHREVGKFRIFRNSRKRPMSQK